METPSGEHRPGAVAVVGATGRQGAAVTRHLLGGGWRVRALTRDPSGLGARALQRLGAEVRRADSEDIGSLRPALAGVHGLFTVQNPMTSGLEAEVRQGRNVAQAAADAGVSHVVYGAAGVGQESTGVGSWDTKVVVAQRFRELGLPLTVLRPMAFMELMTDRGYYPAISVWHVMPRLMGESRPVGWLAVDDLGAIAARMFADPGRWVGQDLGLVADVRSIEECRGIWREVTGRAPRGVPMPTLLFERFVGTDLTTMWRWLRTEQFSMSTTRTREILPGALTVRQWLERTRGRRSADHQR
ncbi:NmrA/HSCARG family protein [Ornithinicoccus halotolerans]|uniref:NmrA/HSCARG family protein n=1 Tax=Ornithinicoccus halotolerans TaxID=1748220 RepID=UPI001297A037|nr:NmrA/HSCARG family protein [Ornithinicoccus halotolerans]